MVSGKVTFNGQPLPLGTIIFKSENDANYRIPTMISNGEYSTKRAPIGKCKVAIETESLTLGNSKDYVPIPKHYGSFEDSGFSADLVAGENKNVDFSLEAQ